MKKFVRSSALIACAVLGFSISTSAHAEQGDMVRMSQMRLADLGYYTGADDGRMGPLTSIALRDFQAYNLLPVTGTLNAETFNLLMAADFRLHHGNLVSRVAYTNMPVAAPLAAAPIGYYGASYIAAPTPAVTHVAYFEDGNGYERIAASPTLPVVQPMIQPVNYIAPAAAPLTYVNDGTNQFVASPAITPVSYTYGSYGYVNAGWHY